jgi:hypothetical protein
LNAGVRRGRPYVKRRVFLATAAGGVLLAARAASAAAGSGRVFVDPRLEALPRRPWRKVHLDYHNTEHLPRLAQDFDADAFGERLRSAHVDAVVVFAKDMHGYFYYPSRFGPVHPGLSHDLLGEQVAACRARSIDVSAYYCVTWDHHLARTRPEWLVRKRDGSTFLPKPGETPGWTGLCLAHEGFVSVVLDHLREVVERHPVDGLWLDMPVPIEGQCFCEECLRQVRSTGGDPFDTRTQRLHKQGLLVSLQRRVHALVASTRPGCQIDFNGQGVVGLGERVPFTGNVDIEALPTAFWGYWYFPTIVRYCRTFGVTTYGMTGRFLASWADFGGLKLPSQLHTELAGIVAQGARCDVGDQLPPRGVLDPAVYHVIGEAYARIEALEPWLEGAAPVTEAALLTAGDPLDSPGREENYGLVRLLIESRVQFDVVEPSAAWERYGLVVLPEDLAVDAGLAARLTAFLAAGGRVLACDRAGLLEGTETSWLEPLGLRCAGRSPFAPAYLLPGPGVTGAIPPYEYALYEGAALWRASLPAETVARLGEPLFQRSPERYTSHAQTPFDHATDFAAAAVSGRLAFLAWPLGRSYHRHGYWVERAVFGHALGRTGFRGLVETSAPLSAEVSVTRQRARADGTWKERYLAHVVQYSPLRKSPSHPEFYEDPVPLAGVRVRLNLDLGRVVAREVPSGRELPLTRVPGGVEATLSRVDTHGIVAFEVGGSA